jgi:hypothetical protein
MLDFNMNRKEFLKSAGKCCIGSCACVLMGGLMNAHADETKNDPSEQKEKPRSETRMEFAENWVTRFMEVLDENLDQETRRKIMMANGKKCYRGWIADTGQQIRQVTLERFTEWVKNNIKDDSIRVDGNIIYFQFNSAAETGLPSEEGQCLCTLVETKPKGLSGTYCDCSVGYVKEWYELLLARPVEVELTESVLRGGKRCKFKITV